MRSTFVTALLGVPLALAAAETPECRFVVGYAAYDAKWLVSQGSAQVTRTASGFEAKLFGEAGSVEPTHRLSGTTKQGQATAVLTNMFSDAGPDRLSGSVVSSKVEVSPSVSKVSESLVVQSGTAFASLACFGETSRLTSRSSGPPSAAAELQR
jgi:hypothetical protein